MTASKFKLPVIMSLYSYEIKAFKQIIQNLDGVVYLYGNCLEVRRVEVSMYTFRKSNFGST